MAFGVEAWGPRPVPEGAIDAFILSPYLAAYADRNVEWKRSQINDGVA